MEQLLILPEFEPLLKGEGTIVYHKQGDRVVNTGFGGYLMNKTGSRKKMFITRVNEAAS